MTYLSLVLSILLTLGAGVVGSISTMKEIPGWYAGLVRPTLAPPNWIFGPVWTTLYILMGIAAWLVYEAGIEKPEVRTALAVYVLQLALNALWSYLFFGLHDLRLAFFELLALWLMIALTIGLFYRISPVAAYLLVPYIAWVSFAGYLNWSFWMLNP
jgi:tryptophan-rich sensory protein